MSCIRDLDNLSWAFHLHFNTISEAMAKNKNVGKPRNYALESGVYR